MEAKVSPNKANTGQNLEVKLRNTKEIKSTKNDTIVPKQLVLTKYYPLQATEKMSIKQVGQGLTRLGRGLGLPGAMSPKDLINNPTILAGKTGLWKIAIKQETAEFPEGNEIKDIVIEG